jgi:HlyD family secretion protein
MRMYSLRGRVAAGLIVVVISFGGLSAYALSEPGSAVITAGAVSAGPNARRVQHPTGGIVAEIFRREGERVSMGEIVARLDDAVVRTNLDLSNKTIYGLAARRARLDAERESSNEIAFPDYLGTRLADPDVARTLTSERELFARRASAQRSEKELQQLRIALLENEISGYESQASSKDRESSLIQRELDGVRQLRDKNLVSVTRLTELERDAVRVNAEQHGMIPISIAQARGRIADIQLQMMSADRDRMREVFGELRETEARLDNELRRKADYEDQLRRAEIRAPQDGIIYKSLVRSVGCEVAAGEQLMLVVPPTEKPMVEARIEPRYVQRLRVGQNATLLAASAGAATRFSGRLDEISQAAVREESSGQIFYTLRFTVLADGDVAAATGPLSPGEQVEISINTGGGRRLKDLVKPLVFMARPFGERLAAVF